MVLLIGGCWLWSEGEGEGGGAYEHAGVTVVAARRPRREVGVVRVPRLRAVARESEQ